MQATSNTGSLGGKSLSCLIIIAMLLTIALPANIAQADPGAIDAPEFSISAGIYDEPQVVALSADMPDAVIRYTTDGTEPNSSSAVYSEPFHVNTALQIRAYAESPDGLHVSEIVEGLYAVASIGLEWSDDFSQFSDNDWVTYPGQSGAGEWSEDNGRYSANQVQGSKAMIAPLDDARPKHFVFEADINPYASQQNSGFVLRVTEPGSGADTMSGYFVGFSSTGTLAASKMTRDGSTGAFTLIRRNEGVDAANVTPNQMNRLKVIGLGTTYYIYVNDRFEFAFTDKEHTIGSFGLRAWNNNGDITFDNVYFAELINDNIGQPEPDLSEYLVDEFNGDALHDDWSIFQEIEDRWSLAQNPGYLTINTTATDLYQVNNSLNNLFLKDAPDNFEIIASLHAPILRNHQQAGLIVFQDVDNFFRVGHVWTQGRKAIETGRETNGSYQGPVSASHPGSLQVTLKIRKEGNQYTGYYWDAGNWVQTTDTTAMELENIKVGFYGNNNVAPNYPINVRVDYFAMKSIEDQSGGGGEGPVLPGDPPPVIHLPYEGMEAWYKLDEAEGSMFALDSSGNYEHSFIATGTWLPEGGLDGGAILLNGTSHVIRLNGPNSPFLRNAFTEQSASLWFKANKTLSRQVLYERGGNLAGLAIQLFDNKLEAAVVSGGVRHIISVDFTDTSSWHHVLVSFNEGDFRMYLDGVQVAQANTSFTQVAAAANGGGIGGRVDVDAFGGTNFGAHFDGLIDDVRLYSVAVEPGIGEVQVDGVTVPESRLDMEIGDVYKIVASLNPVNATNTRLHWSSSNDEIVAIASTEFLRASVEAKLPGSVTITVTTDDGAHTAHIPVTVSDAELQSIQLNPMRISLPANVEYQFTAAYEPANAVKQNLIWSSDNPEVAAVTGDGMVTTLSPGKAVITASTEQGDYSASGTITVEEADEDSVYMMSYFRSDIAQTGQKDEKLYYSYSRDGVRWYELNSNMPVAEFDNPLRDPFIARGEDGIWRLMFTGATNNTADSRAIFSMLGLAESRDLINWNYYSMLDVMKAYKDNNEIVFNSWAPEWSYDPVNEEYVIYWSSTVGDYSSGDNKHYYTTTRDWRTFSDAALFFDPDHKTIDATLYPLDADELIDGQRVRDRLGIPEDKDIPGNIVWMMFYKDETHENQGGMRNRQTWSDEGITGISAYQNPSHISGYVTPLRTEGASIFKVGDQWHMLYDYWWAGKFGLLTTPDLTNPDAWSEENMDLRIPYRARHAGMSMINTRELWNLINHYSLEAYYPFKGGAADESGRGHNGESIGSPSYAPQGTASYGYARFGGEADAVRLTHADDAFYIRTISMWVKADDSSETQMLYHEGNSDGGLALKLEAGELIAGVSKQSELKQVSADFADTDWHYVTVVYEEGMLKLYVDGELKEQLNTGFQPKQTSLNPNGEAPKSRAPELYHIERGSNVAYVGVGAANDVFGADSEHAYFNGMISELGIYTLPLFDQDIVELYMSNKELFERAAEGAEPGSGGSGPAPSPLPESHEIQTTEDGDIVIVASGQLDEERLVKVQLDSAHLEQAFGQAHESEDGTYSITVDIPPIEGANGYRLSLPQEWLAEEKKTRTIRLHTAFATIDLPDNLVADGGQQGMVSITVRAVETAALDGQLNARFGNRPVIAIELESGERSLRSADINGKVAMTIPYVPSPAERNEEEYLSIWHMDEHGNIRPIPNGRYDSETGGMIVNAKPVGHYIVAFAKKSFEDLNHNEWARKPIEVLAAKGVIAGVDDRSFVPDGLLTRADYVLLLARLFDLQGDVSSNFRDVDEGAYYYEAVGVAKALGLVSGIDGDNFAPNAAISRQDMMVLTARILEPQHRHQDDRNTESINHFADYNDISPYAREAVATLVHEQLIEGWNNLLLPMSNATRAEAATFLYKMYQKQYTE